MSCFAFSGATKGARIMYIASIGALLHVGRGVQEREAMWPTNSGICVILTNDGAQAQYRGGLTASQRRHAPTNITRLPFSPLSREISGTSAPHLEKPFQFFTHEPIPFIGRRVYDITNFAPTSVVSSPHLIESAVAGAVLSTVH